MPDDTFYRVETHIQTSLLAQIQVTSGEVWGREPYGSGFLVVQAYRGTLPTGRRGIEFKTAVTPQRGHGSPFEARWYYPETVGVMLRHKEDEDFAAIPAIIDNRQP